MSVTVILNAFHKNHPDDGTYIPYDGMSLLVISNVERKDHASGHVKLLYNNGTINFFTISEGLVIDLELHCLGFQFSAPELKEKQELKFTYQLFV